MHHFARLHAGEPGIQPLKLVTELLIIDPKLMQ
jgi:hypothetical protein